jgi:flagellin-like protein
MHYWYKKGVSPLIATILLLAFAVALATVIIQLEPFGRCKGDEISIDAGQSCFSKNGQKIRLWIQNNDFPLSGFRVYVSGNQDIFEAKMDALVESLEPIVLDIPYDEAAFGAIREVSVVAIVNRSGSPVDCQINPKIMQLRLCE